MARAKAKKSKAPKKNLKAARTGTKVSKRTSKASKRVPKAAKRAKEAPKKAAKAAKAATAAKATKPAKAAKVAKAVKVASKSARKLTTRSAVNVKPKAKAKAAKAQAATPSAKARPKARPASAKADTLSARRPPGLDRERRTIRDVDPTLPSPPSSLDMDRTASAVRSGRHELAERLRKHTSTGPALTGGDVDADWEDAESVGDAAPGGDNPTPDQDVVDEIGQALGITYEDNEELKGGDELAERDRHRWELDPASREDYNEED